MSVILCLAEEILLFESRLEDQIRAEDEEQHGRCPVEPVLGGFVHWINRRVVRGQLLPHAIIKDGENREEN